MPHSGGTLGEVPLGPGLILAQEFPRSLQKSFLKWDWTVLSDTRRDTPDESYSAASRITFSAGQMAFVSATASKLRKQMIRREFLARNCDLSIRPRLSRPVQQVSICQATLFLNIARLNEADKPW
jgi:hypothetical protein